MLGYECSATNIENEISEWIMEDNGAMLIKYCVIYHIHCLRDDWNKTRAYLEYFENSIIQNKAYYKNITWNEFKRNFRSYSKFRCGYLMMTIRQKCNTVTLHHLRNTISRFFIYSCASLTILIIMRNVVFRQFYILWSTDALIPLYVALLIVISLQLYRIVYHASIYYDICELSVQHENAWIEIKRYYKYISHDCDRLSVGANLWQ